MQTKFTFLINVLLGIFSLSLFSTAYSQSPNIVLGRPTDSSVTVSIMFSQNTDCFFQYGIIPGNYLVTTGTNSLMAKVPEEIDLSGLQPNTRYYYRVNYKPTGSGSFTQSNEYSFYTQRSPGSTFTFTIEADEHLYDKKGVDNMYRVTLANQAADNPDFMLSLGDIFGDDHTPLTTTSHDMDSLHYAYRPFLGAICHSIPFYVCLGNHEGENDYYYSLTPPNNICVYGTQWRKYYFPNPYPNNFYTGDTVTEPYGIGNPENYYAWKWGDALFVVLDVYRDECDTSAKPQKWDWSLGTNQYNWLKNTLESSIEKYKFVFAHHIRGQGRGGITNATQFEWGGIDGGQYKFPQHRPDFAKPIHQLFVDNGVNIFFQGHDHLFAHEVLDSVTYQEVPMAADSTYEIGMLANADAYTADTLDGTGHIRVTVSSACVTVDYIRAYLPADTLSGAHHNREVAFSYTIGDCNTTGIEKINTENQLQVFPNPANNKLKVMLSSSEKQVQFNLINAFGETILITNQTEIDVNNLANGIYLIHAQSENFSSNKKILIQH